MISDEFLLHCLNPPHLWHMIGEYLPPEQTDVKRHFKEIGGSKDFLLDCLNPPDLWHIVGAYLPAEQTDLICKKILNPLCQSVIIKPKSIDDLKQVNRFKIRRLDCSDFEQIHEDTFVPEAAYRLALITDQLFEAITRQLPNLEEIVFPSAISDEFLKCFGNRITQLTTLDLRHCMWGDLFDMALPLLERNPHIERIDLEGVWWAHGQKILRIVRRCPRLTYLNISNCDSLGDTALTYIGEHGNRLEHLHIAGSSHITESAIASLQRTKPNLQIHR